MDNIFNKKSNTEINNLFHRNNNLFSDDRDINEERMNNEDDKAFNDLFESKNNVKKNNFNNNVKQNDDAGEDVLDELLI